MTELAEAIARLEQAVARLEAAADPKAAAARERRIADAVTTIARIDRLLEREE